ncbi:hypothetical protein ACFL02_06550 [Planctomycetota bacterium]
MKKRNSVFRRLVRLSLITFCIVLLLLVIIQVILWTDLPRQWVLQIISEKTGINVRAEYFSTGWKGETKIKNVSLALPMEQEPFLRVEEINISHNSLLFLLLSRSLTCESIETGHSTIFLRQDLQGRWNLEDIILMAEKMMSSMENKQANISLPVVAMEEVNISIAKSADQMFQIGPVEFHGVPDDSQRWRFDLQVPKKIKITGQIAPEQIGAHKIDFEFLDGEDLLKPWFPNDINPVCLSGNWEGRIKERKLTGKLNIQYFQLGRTEIKGLLDLIIDASGLHLQPENLTVYHPGILNDELSVESGDIRYYQNKIQAVQLVLESWDHILQINGIWDRVLEKGEFSGSWVGAFADLNVYHQGSWRGEILWPQASRKQIIIDIDSLGRSPWGFWESQTNTISSGKNWQNLHWQTNIPHWAWRHKGREVILGPIAATLESDWPHVQLTALNVANADIKSAKGEFSATDRSWLVELVAEEVEMVSGKEPYFDLSLSASGDPCNLTVTAFNIIHPDLTLSGSGTLDLPSTKFHEARVISQWSLPASNNTKTDNKSFSGDWQLETKINGTVRPFNMEFRADLQGENVTIGKQNISRIDVPFQGSINRKQAAFQTEDFTLFDGSWHLEGQYDISQRVSKMDLVVRELSLRSPAEIIGSPLQWEGAISAELQLVLPFDQLDQLKATGYWQAKELKMPPFEAMQGTGEIMVHNGIVRFDKIHLLQNQGRAQAGMWFSLNRPEQLFAEITADSWPVDFTKHNFQLNANGHTKLQIDVLKRSATGDGKIVADIIWDKEAFGNLTVDISVEERTVNVGNFALSALDGAVEGAAKIPLDDWFASSAEIEWRNLNLAPLADWRPWLHGISGSSSGMLRIKRAEQLRPLEPLSLEMQTQFTDASFRGMQFTNAQVTSYAGPERFIVEQSEIELADGVARVQLSVRQHEGELFTYAHSNIDRFDLKQLANDGNINAQDVVGRLSGEITAVISADPDRLSGQADLKITESDLARNQIVGTLYNALNLNFAQDNPSGEGQIKLRAEGMKLTIPSFAYFNRGVEIRGSGTIMNLKLGTDSAIEGYAFGTSRPLKGLRLPGIDELDRLITNIQRGAAAVKIGGTLGKPEPVIVPFPEIDATIRRLLWNQLRDK